MPVPSAITDLSTTAGSNSPAGTDSIGTNMDDYVRAHAAFLAQLRDGSKNLALASAGAPALAFTGDANTGIYSPSADQVGVAVGGSKGFAVTSIGTESPLQPTFNGRDSAARTTTGDFGTYTEVFDVGSNFNASSGVFTAPKAGKYLFAFIAGGYASSAGYAEIHLQINGSSGYSANICPNLSTLSTYVGGSAVIDMALNDTAKINLSSYSGTGATLYVRSFSGLLIG